MPSTWAAFKRSIHNRRAVIEEMGPNILFQDLNIRPRHVKRCPADVLLSIMLGFAGECFENLAQFCDTLAALYNQGLDVNQRGQHPLMTSFVGKVLTEEYFTCWCLREDLFIEGPETHHSKMSSEGTEDPRSVWAVELTSPILRPGPSSSWRSQVQHVWAFLHSVCYVSTNYTCGTHVHLSVPGGYTLAQLQSISKAILHFEPGFEVLLPASRRANSSTMSNWLDNENFGLKGLSREESMEVIDAARSTHEVAWLMSPGDKYWGWNLRNLLYRFTGTVEYRRGPGCEALGETLLCVEIAMGFVGAAMAHGGVGGFLPTVGGLRDFVRGARLDEGVHDLIYFDMVTDNAGGMEFLEPLPHWQGSIALNDMGRRLAQDDGRRIEQLVAWRRRGE